MAGNFTSNKKVDIKFASMSLHWNNPAGDDFEPWLKKVKAIGYDGVTCFAEGLECFLDKPSELKSMLDNAGLKLAAVDFQLADSPEKLVRMLDLMNAVESDILVVIVHKADIKTPELYRYYADRVNQVGGISLKRGIRTHLHNNSDSIGRNMTDWQKLIPLLDFSKVFLMSDTGHATKDFDELPHQERAVKFINDNWEKLSYLELKDYNEKTDLDTPLGEGLCDLNAIFGMITDRGYTGWITLEQNQNNGLSLGRSPELCAEISLEYARKGLVAVHL
jgi:inosose dehydratase